MPKFPHFFIMYTSAEWKEKKKSSIHVNHRFPRESHLILNPGTIWYAQSILLTIQQQKNYRYKKPPGTCIISKHILFRYSIIKNIICTSILPYPHPHPIVQQQVTA